MLAAVDRLKGFDDNPVGMILFDIQGQTLELRAQTPGAYEAVEQLPVQWPGPTRAFVCAHAAFRAASPPSGAPNRCSSDSEIRGRTGKKSACSPYGKSRRSLQFALFADAHRCHPRRRRKETNSCNVLRGAVLLIAVPVVAAQSPSFSPGTGSPGQGASSQSGSSAQGRNPADNISAIAPPFDVDDVLRMHRVGLQDEVIINALRARYHPLKLSDSDRVLLVKNSVSAAVIAAMENPLDADTVDHAAPPTAPASPVPDPAKAVAASGPTPNKPLPDARDEHPNAKVVESSAKPVASASSAVAASGPAGDKPTLTEKDKHPNTEAASTSTQTAPVGIFPCAFRFLRPARWTPLRPSHFQMRRRRRLLGSIVASTERDGEK